MYGAQAAKLIQDAKRISSLDYLPIYATDLVHGITREIRDLQRDVQIILSRAPLDFRASQDKITACAIFMLQLCMRRNKRCLFAYHRLRANKVQELAWSGMEPSELSDQELDRSMNNDHIFEKRETVMMERSSPTSGWHADEEEYFRKYSDNLAEIKGDWTDIDLMGSMEPPRDLFIDVRVLKDAGEIQTEYGQAIIQFLANELVYN